MVGNPSVLLEGVSVALRPQSLLNVRNAKTRGRLLSLWATVWRLLNLKKFGQPIFGKARKDAIGMKSLLCTLLVSLTLGGLGGGEDELKGVES